LAARTFAASPPTPCGRPQALRAKTGRGAPALTPCGRTAGSPDALRANPPPTTRRALVAVHTFFCTVRKSVRTAAGGG
jgi:hypothetical protein